MKGLPESTKEFLKTTKGKAALGGGAAAVVGAVVAISMLLTGQAYRTIAVQEVNGTSIIQNEKQESSNAYAGMHLNSGDDVTVQAASDMTLLLDMDKYVYAEENTHFWLEAEGDRETSKTRIYLDQGAELNRLNTGLTEGEEYEVDTPNSVMAVRGTVFRVCVRYDSDGLAWTSLEVYEGNVEVSLKTLEGEFNGVSEVFGSGESALIRASSDFSEFVAGEENEVKLPIDYKEIPPNTARKLVGFMDDGEELCIGRELLMDYAKLEDHKTEEVITEEATCSKEGKKELRCIVCDEVEETVTIPKLPHEVPEEWEIVKEPSCLERGEERKVCADCGEVIETREREALGHTPDRFVVTTEATCTQAGERVMRCTVCNEILQREAIAALGHAAGDWQSVIDPTCITEGQMAKMCARCGATVETLSVPALGHSSGDWTVTSQATCTSDGSQSRTCTRCGVVLETSSIPARGHSYGEWITTSRATCTSDGSRRRICSRCGAVDTIGIGASGHSYGEWAEDTPATCIKTGSKSRTCSGCGNVETSVIPLAEHTYTTEYIDHGISSNNAKDIVAEIEKNNSASVSVTRQCDVCGAVKEEHTITSLKQNDTDAGGTFHCETCNEDVEFK